MAKIATSRKKASNEEFQAPVDDFQKIQQLAYQFFVDRGHIDGFDKEDWARAEAVVRKKRI